MLRHVSALNVGYLQGAHTFLACAAYSSNYIVEFYVLLTVHPCIIL